MEVAQDNSIHGHGAGGLTQQEKQANFDFRGRADSSESWKSSKKMYAEFAYSPPKRAIDSYVPPGEKVKSKDGGAQTSGDFNMVDKLRSIFDDKPAASTSARTQSAQPAYYNRQLLNSQVDQPSKAATTTAVQPTTRATRDRKDSSGDEGKHKSNFAKFNLPPHGGSILSARKAKFEQVNTKTKDVSIPPTRESLQRKPPLKLEELIKKDETGDEHSTTDDTHPHDNGAHGDTSVTPSHGLTRGSYAVTPHSVTPMLSVTRRRSGDGDSNKKSMAVRPSSQEFAGLEENIQVYGNKPINIQSLMTSQTSADDVASNEGIYDDIQADLPNEATKLQGRPIAVSTTNGVAGNHDTAPGHELYENFNDDASRNVTNGRYSSHVVSEQVLPESDFGPTDEDGFTAVRVANVHHAAPSNFFGTLDNEQFHNREENDYTELNGGVKYEEENIYEDLDAPSTQDAPSSIYDDAVTVSNDASLHSQRTNDSSNAGDNNWQMTSDVKAIVSPQAPATIQDHDVNYILTSEEDESDDDDDVPPEAYSLPPPPSHSCLAHNKSPRRNAGSVTFHEKERLVVPTYSPWEYDRANMGIDPVTASAEWELEKRVEKMDIFSVDLQKGDRGLGLSIIGLGVGTETGIEKLGIFVKTLTPGGSAQRDGRIQVNDQILEVNNVSLVGVTQHFAAYTLKNTSGIVRFLMGRDKGRRHYGGSGDTNLQELERLHNEELNDLLSRLQESDERANELEALLDDVKLTLVETEERTYVAEGAVEELKQELHLVKQKPDERKKGEKLDELQRSLHDVSVKLSSSEENLLKLYDENEEKHSELQSLRMQLQDAETTCEGLQGENRTLLENAKTKAEELATVQEELTKSKHDHAELIKHVDAYRERYERLEAELEDIREQNVGEEVMDKLAEVENSNREHVNMMEGLREKNERLMQRVRELEKTVGVKETMALKLVQENDFLQELVAKLEHSEKEARAEGEAEEYKRLARMHEDRAAALEIELKKMKELHDKDSASRKFFSDLDATSSAALSVPTARVGPKVIKQESVGSSSDTLSSFSLAPIPSQESMDDDFDDENVDDDKQVARSVVHEEAGMDFSMFDSLPPDEPEPEQETQYVNPVPMPPRKVSKEESPSRGATPVRRHSPGHPPVTEDSVTEQAIADVESSQFSEDDLLAALDKIDRQDEENERAGSVDERPGVAGKLPSSSGLGSYKYDPAGRLFPDFGELRETSVDSPYHSELNLAKSNSVQDVHVTQNGVKVKDVARHEEQPATSVAATSTPTAAVTPIETPDEPSEADKRSSFLDALREDPNFGTWLDDGFSVRNKEAQDDHAEEIATRVLSQSADDVDSVSDTPSPTAAAPASLSPTSSTLTVESPDGGKIEGRRNTVKLDETYLNATEKRNSDALEASALQTSIDDQDCAIVHFDAVPSTDILDTSLQRDKLKVASGREKRKPSHNSIGSGDVPVAIEGQFEMDLSDGRDTPDDDGARPVAGPISPLSDDAAHKEKSKKFNFHFPKIPGLRKLHKRPSEDHLAGAADARKPRKTSRDKRHSMYDTRLHATDYGEEDVVPLSSKSEISLQQSLNDAATAEAVVPLHDKLRQHHSAGEDASDGQSRDLAIGDDVFSSGASSHGSDILSPTLSAESIDATAPVDVQPSGDANDGQRPRPVIGGPIAHWEQRPVNEWDTRQVGLWLVGMDMNHFVKSFHDRSIDGEQLLLLDGTKLKDLGVYNGDERTRLKKKVKEFRVSVDREQKGKDARHGGKKDARGKEPRTKKLFWKGRYTVND